ncbi:hypothetical protein CIK92_04635 [Prevotella sp. P4-67]|nr:hypothetical protein CIK92_04635 [Prevotella sp. P4-67]
MERQGGGSGVCIGSGASRQQVDQDTLHAARGALHDAQGTLHAARGALHDAQGTLHAARGTLHAAQGTLHATRGALHDAQGTLHAAQGTLHAAGDSSPDIRAAGQRRRGPHEAYCKAGNDKIVA